MTGGEGKLIRRCICIHAVLPIEIIEKEILCRLPVKSLLRCKSVCKLWYSLVKNPNFITNHYHHNRNRPIFVQKFTPFEYERPITLKPGVHFMPLPIPIPMVNDLDLEAGAGANLFFSSYIALPWRHIFVRPVNGFLLVLLPDNLTDRCRCRMAMFNPATRQFRQLCDFKFNTLSKPTKLTHYSIGNHIFGFGICKYTDTNPPHAHVYKVVWLNVPPEEDGLNVPPEEEENDVAVAKVFTVGGGGDWKMINGAFPRRFVHKYTSRDPNKNISLNGKCYWLSKDFAHILVFDMDEEVFREMDSPVSSVYPSLPEFFYTPKAPFGYTYNRKTWDAVFSEVRCYGDEGNSLALFIFDTGSVDMSVMDKEEDWHWIRRMVTCIDRPISDLSNPLELFHFPITDDSILLKAGRTSFALYNPKTNRCVHFRQPSPRDAACSTITVFNFKESLFSVEGGIQVSDRVLEDFSIF